MQTIRRAAAVLIYPAILCLGVACERADTPTSSPPARGPRADLTAPAPNTDWLVRALSLGELLSDDPRMTAWTDEPEDDDNDAITVVPFEFDPFHTNLVRSRWLRGTGCATGATVWIDDPTTPLVFAPQPKPYSDPACNAMAGGGDPKDGPGKNEGLLLVKTGPTGNDAAAGADLKGVKGITLTELGYDIRKPLDPNDPRGSHCGNGAPRFNVRTTVAFYFIGCNSPPVVPAGASASWLRLRWGPGPVLMPCVPGFNTSTGLLECVAGTVQSIAIIFDEGDDTGPDNVGLAVLDNIDVNGQLVGRGPGN